MGEMEDEKDMEGATERQKHTERDGKGRGRERVTEREKER